MRCGKVIYFLQKYYLHYYLHSGALRVSFIKHPQEYFLQLTTVTLNHDTEI